MTTEIPMYEPPYDSPIEDIFAWHLSKSMPSNLALEAQVEVPTIVGAFRVDFAVFLPDGRRIAFECDGKEFHEGFHDEWRDALILDTKIFESIYRFNGAFIVNGIQDLLFLLAGYEPLLFSERAKTNIDQLASETIRRCEVSKDSNSIPIQYPEEPPRSAFLAKFNVRSLCRPYPDRSQLLRLIAITLTTKGNTLEEKIKWHLEHLEFKELT